MAKRTIKIDLRLNETEYQALSHNVERSGLSREAYLRALIGNKPLKERPPSEFHAVLHELRNIGNNLNRLANVATNKGFVDAASYWENLHWLQEAIGQLVRGVYG